MSKFIASWLASAATVLEAEFGLGVDLLPGAAIAAESAAFTLTVDLAGDWEGTFTASVDERALDALLRNVQTAGGAGDAAAELAAESGAEAAAEAGGEAGEPAFFEAVREEWQRLFRRICIAAAADLSASSGAACEVAMISPEGRPGGSSGMGYQLHAASAMAALLLFDQVARTAAEPGLQAPVPPPANAAPAGAVHAESEPAAGYAAGSAAIDAKGMELLLDVELEAALRFGSREMTLSDLLALGPGDVIQLDRALTDPVDLIIGDKIVARGEVVLVNGNFGLQIAEVAEPRKSLESIRCLF